jgi:hypothetical protein
LRTPGRATALLFVLAALLVTAGCGDDEETEISVPTIDLTETAAPATPTTTPTEPSNTGTVDTTKPDSPSNDIPPPPGSPQGKFEEFCKQNPGACG